ncbi:MAG TPA: hypothetical protein VJ993_05775 [Woeseiaceae bacterium]|nr:hypothetical protein [Woeseiaceae bacterium]
MPARITLRGIGFPEIESLAVEGLVFAKRYGGPDALTIGAWQGAACSNQKEYDHQEYSHRALAFRL